MVAILVLATLAPGRAWPDPVELPPEAAEGADHAQESGDSLASGDLELGMGMSGTADALTSRRRRVRFSEPDLQGTLREGPGDPLAGGRLESRARAADVAVGTLSPRWARGLLLGAAGDPWQRASLTLDGRGRGRGGEGFALRSRSGHQLMLGRFARRDLAAARLGGGALRAGAVIARRGAQTSVALERAHAQSEIALDRSGTWRAAALARREVGRWGLVGALRAGHARFRSLAEPARAGPPRAATLDSEGRLPWGDLRLLAAAWRFRSAEAGGRLAFEFERPLSDGAHLVAGFEEQHGVRREGQRDPGMRQGAWLEWSRLAGALGLAARHEAWTARGGLRDLVRAVTAVRIVARGPAGTSLSLGHALYRVRRGESLYLRESESDRIVLRALSGEGHRTRVDLALPLARGTLRAALHLDVRDGTRRAPRWDLEWSRRTRAPRSPGARERAPSRPASRPEIDSTNITPPLAPPLGSFDAQPGDTAGTVPPDPRPRGARRLDAAPQ